MSEETTETGSAFAKRLSITIETVIAAPEVSEGGRQRTQWWECILIVGDRRETFRYGMGDGHREEGPNGSTYGKRQRYAGRMPATYHPDGTPHKWPKGTRTVDADRYERSRLTRPELAEVLECLAMDAQMISEDYGHTDFGEWAEEFGYEKPGEAWRVWNALQDNARKLRKLFGSEYRSFLNVREE